MNKGGLFRNLFVLLGTVLVLVCLAYLPKGIAIFQDKKILSQAQIEEIQSVQLNMQKELPAMGKLALMKSVHKGNAIEISTEEVAMSVEEVQNKVLKALQPYYDAELIVAFEEDKCECRPLLVWDTENSLSGTVWQWTSVAQKKKFCEIGVLLDDESGEILMIQYTGNHVFEDSIQKNVLLNVCDIYFESLQISDYENFAVDDLEHQYIGDNVQGNRYRFGDVVYGEVNVDFFVSQYGFYMEFPNLTEDVE